MVLCGTIALLAFGTDSKKGLRISGPMTALAFGGDVIEAKFTPDGTRAVFSGDADQDGLSELYSVPTDGSAPPVELNSPVVSGGDVQGFLLSPDSERVVFWGDLSTDGKRELYSAPIDASSPAVKLNAPIGAGGSVTMTFEPCVQISPDSTRVVYLAVSGTDVHELFSVPIDGSAPAAKINGPLVTGGDVGFFINSGGLRLFRPGFLISPDSSRVVYMADQEVDGPSELFAVPIDGGPTIQLNHPLPPGTFLEAGLQISPDGQWVTYLAKSSEQELFSVPIDAHLPAVRLNAELFGPSSRVDYDYRISADSSTVYFRADHDQGQLLELCRVPIDGSAAPLQLVDLATYPGVEYGFEIGATHAAYRRGEELFSVPLDGSAPPTQISGPKPLASFDVPLRITAEGSRVVYRSVQGSAKQELYTVPVDASALPVRLNSHLVFGGNVLDFALAPTGDRVVYRADGQLMQVFELYSVPVDASAPAVKINAPLVPAGDVQSVSTSDSIPEFEIGPDGARVIYLADQEIPDVVELFAVPIDGSLPAVRLNGGLSAPTLAGDVTAFALAPVGNHAVYRADQDTDEVFELYGVPLPRSPFDPIAPANRLSGPYQNVTFGFRVSPDGSRVVYRASRDDIVFTSQGYELFSAPVDGSSPAVRISQPLGAVGTVGTFEISPDSSRVVYLAEPYRTDTVELFMTAIDGSSPPVHLNQPFHRFGTTVSGHRVDDPIEREVQHFRISPDGSRVVYEADQDRASVFELYAVPIDRSQRPRKLHPSLDSGRVTLMGISPDSQRVLFLGLGGQLHSAAIDASGPAIALTEPPLLPGSCGTVTITPDSSRVVFVARTEGSNFSELFSVPLDGSQSPTRLSAAFPQGSEGFCALNTPGFKLSPVGDRVVYGAEQATLGVLELFSVPVDGSAPATKLNPALPSGGNVWTFEISPDGTRVVYGAEQDVDGLFEVFAVPIDGSAAPVQINGPVVAGGGAGSASISPDGLRVLYRADKDTNDVFELFSAPLRGGQSVKASAPLVAGGDVQLPGSLGFPFYGITPDGTRVVYVADQETDERFELHLSFLNPYARRR